MTGGEVRRANGSQHFPCRPETAGIGPDRVVYHGKVVVPEVKDAALMGKKLPDSSR